MVEHPFIYEINTWVWLDELRARAGKQIGLAGVPAARVGCDRGARLRRGLADGRLGAQPGRDRDRARRTTGLLESFRRALPDFTTADVVGSPYCIRDYTVDAHLGGPEGLAVGARRRSPSAGSG